MSPREPTEAVSDVHLVPCHPSQGKLDFAPRTSLREDNAHEQWDGFWAENDRYYTRCTGIDGSESWFRIVDGRRPSYASVRRPSRVTYVAPRMLTRDARRAISRRGPR